MERWKFINKFENTNTNFEKEMKILTNKWKLLKKNENFEKKNEKF